jgi:glycolate oxidase iron-sulfur subunit
MQTQLAGFIRDTAAGQEADAILRSCVHCGFCTATCPTYQWLGDELDGPRGRIYQIKQVLEGVPATPLTQLHLDRCLTCRACETTCPSGVRYARLLDIGRQVVERQVPRPWLDRLVRQALLVVLPRRRRFTALLRLGQWVRPLLPGPLARKIPPRCAAGLWPTAVHPRSMLVLEGCVQPGATPGTNAAAARVLDRLGIRLIPVAGCCGAVSHHLGAESSAHAQMRRNIDAWWPQLAAGAEAILSNASGCGVMVKDYGLLLAGDPRYAERAARLAALTRDLAEVLAAEDLGPLGRPGRGRRIAFHAPCSLQHGQKLPGIAEGILTRLGFTLTPVPDAHLCCGSAGTYSILQPGLSRPLLNNKLASLESAEPECIATANIGCQLHLASAARVPVRHWIELLDQD